MTYRAKWLVAAVRIDHVMDRMLPANCASVVGQELSGQATGSAGGQLGEPASKPR